MGHFVKAAETCAESCLFDSAVMNEHHTVNNLTPGDLVKIRHTGLELKWQCYECDGLVKGPIDPAMEAEILLDALPQITFHRGHTLGRMRHYYYLAKVCAVNRTAYIATIDAIYQNPMALGNNGLPIGLGSLEWAGVTLPLTQESDVALERVRVISKNSWFEQFMSVWKGWGRVFCSADPTCEPGKVGEQEDSQHRSEAEKPSGDGFQQNSSRRPAMADQEKKKGERVAMDVQDGDLATADGALPAQFRRLARSLRDTAEAHRFRCRELLANKDELQTASEEVRAKLIAFFPGERLADHALHNVHSSQEEQLGSSAVAAEGVPLWPRQAHMEAGKSLFYIFSAALPFGRFGRQEAGRVAPLARSASALTCLCGWPICVDADSGMGKKFCLSRPTPRYIAKHQGAAPCQQHH